VRGFFIGETFAAGRPPRAKETESVGLALGEHHAEQPPPIREPEQDEPFLIPAGTPTFWMARKTGNTTRTTRTGGPTMTAARRMAVETARGRGVRGRE
jgi:hypothetical protein